MINVSVAMPWYIVEEAGSVVTQPLRFPSIFVLGRSDPDPITDPDPQGKMKKKNNPMKVRSRSYLSGESNHF